MADKRYHLPSPGDIVWCRFPEDMRLKPAAKARPALVLAVGHAPEDPGLPFVEVAPGTSRKTSPGQVYRWELLIEIQRTDSFVATGLSFTTKFSLRGTLQLPYTTQFFAPPPRPRFGRTPKLGILHPRYMAALRAAAAAA